MVKLSAPLGRDIRDSSGRIYRIVEYLDSGAFGDVFRAEDRKGHAVAVKVLRALPTRQTELVALLNEIELASKVRHPNVVEVLGTSTDQGDLGPYLVMELVEGSTLEAKLGASTQPIPLSQSLALMRGIAEGARAINAFLVHRDIRLSNILMAKATPKIADFGLSKIVGASTRSKTFKGGQHVAYMAPEGWQRQPNTPKIDVYSVGIVFHQILTGSHPLEHLLSDPADWQEWRDAHLSGQPAGLSETRTDLSSALQQIVTRMIAKRSQDRPDWDEIIATLDNANADTITEASPVAGAVLAAIRQQERAEAARLAAERAADSARNAHTIYERSCRSLVEQFDRLAHDFNRLYQGGAIRIGSDSGSHVLAGVGRRYELPTGENVTVTFFGKRDDGPALRGGTIAGGGILGSTRGASCNLVLLKEHPDDLYGRWLACFVRINAIANASRLLGTRGLTQHTVIPFGFSNEGDYWEEIHWANGGLHVFTYEIRSDMDQVFADVVESAIKGPDGTDRVV
jgi:hypothetical protein